MIMREPTVPVPDTGSYPHRVADLSDRVLLD